MCKGAKLPGLRTWELLTVAVALGLLLLAFSTRSFRERSDWTWCRDAPKFSHFLFLLITIAYY
jgi:hypothetical protein